MSRNIYRVSISEFKVAKAPDILRITGLGSCVGLVLHDPSARIGGLAHILLPGPAPAFAGTGNPGLARGSKYADQAVATLVKTIEEMGGQRDKLAAKIVGGSNMFTSAVDMDDQSPVKAGIGERNVESVKSRLKDMGIRIAGEDVGGTKGRSIVFDLETGEVWITNPRGGQKLI